MHVGEVPDRAKRMLPCTVFQFEVCVVYSQLRLNSLFDFLAFRFNMRSQTAQVKGVSTAHPDGQARLIWILKATQQLPIHGPEADMTARAS
jgi:hypothetical protein